MIITPVNNIYKIQTSYIQRPVYSASFDSYSVENPNVDKKVLANKGIIDKNTNINEYFSQISKSIFGASNMTHPFEKLLQGGYISLSSSAYTDLKNPKSAIGIKLDPKKSTIQNCAELEQYVKDGFGVGINFSEFKNPNERIKTINNYFLYRQKSTKRPPAAIALLNINHPKILDFIALKDNADYKNWCFDLSVVIDDEFFSKLQNNENIELSDGSKLNSREIYDKLLFSMLKSGEPGIIFSNKKDYICDCCAASELKPNEGLTLAHINLSKFYNPKTNSLDYSFLDNASNTLSQAVKKVEPNAFIGVLGYQELLDKLNIKYGSNEANKILEKCLKIIQKQAKAQDLKLAISPTGTISRLLKTTPSIEPKNNQDITYYQEIDTMAAAQKYLDGGISKTIKLKDNYTTSDIDKIIRYSKQKGIKGISVFPS